MGRSSRSGRRAGPRDRGLTCRTALRRATRTVSTVSRGIRRWSMTVPSMRLTSRSRRVAQWCSMRKTPATEPGSMDSPRPTRSSSESRPQLVNQRGELRVLRLIEVGHPDVLTSPWPSRVTIAMSTTRTTSRSVRSRSAGMIRRSSCGPRNCNAGRPRSGRMPSLRRPRSVRCRGLWIRLRYAARAAGGSQNDERSRPGIHAGGHRRMKVDSWTATAFTLAVRRTRGSETRWSSSPRSS